MWSRSFGGEGPLISSTVQNAEFYSRGIPFQMIPSLDGNLFSFDGRQMEKVPIDVDSLLKSSFRIGDDILINGRKESTTYGVNRSDGNVLYECGFEGCHSSLDQQLNDPVSDVLWIERHSQGIRAHDPRAGGEKWNVFTSQYKLHLSRHDDNCNSQAQNDNVNQDDFSVRLTLASNEVIVIKTHNASVIWKKKFTVPIASVWLIDEDIVYLIDPFESFENGAVSPLSDEPLLFLGRYSGNQLYIQSSSKYSPEAALDVFRDTVDNANDNKMIEYKPKKSTRPSSTGSEIVSLHSDVRPSSSGVFIHGKKSEKTCRVLGKNGQPSRHVNDSTLDESSFDQIIVVSLWYWWREVLAISITMAIVINVVCSCMKKKLRKCISPCISPEVSVTSESNSGITTNVISKSDSSPCSLTIKPSNGSSNGASTTDISSGEFSSRFLADFADIECLGKGGFGVVFQARRKFDDRCYAIKRIRLPSTPEATEKVMREVRALANLEHSNIVRYFYSWSEEPPLGWQEVKDQALLSNLVSHATVLTTNDSVSQVPRKKKGKRKQQTKQPFFMMEAKEPSFSEDNRKENNGDSDFIAFEGSTQPKTNQSRARYLHSQKQDLDPVAIKPEHSSSNSIPRPYLYIQMELCAKNTLREWLLKNKNFRDRNKMIWIFKQITQAVEYVHESGLMHRDLKPSNIFFSLDGSVKVGDFGLVTAACLDNSVPTRNHSHIDLLEKISSGEVTSNGVKNPRHTNNVGTFLYMSPEQLTGVSYCNKVDVFSLGVIFFELLVAFNTEMERLDTLQNVRNSVFPKDFPSSFPEESRLTKKLLSHEPSKRPTANQILGHPLLQNAKPDKMESRVRRRTISVSDSGDSQVP